MRVAIVGMGGVTTTFRNWPERVIGRALAERGHEVANIAYYDPRQPALSQYQEVVDGIRVSRVPVQHWPNAALYRALQAAGPFDVMHLLHPRNVLAYGATRWAKRRGIATVYTWLGPFHDRYLIDDRERPLDEQPKYGRLIWIARPLSGVRYAMATCAIIPATIGCIGRSRQPICCCPAPNTRPRSCVRWA